MSTAYRAISSITGRISHDTSPGAACAAMTDRILAGGTWTRDGDREEMPSVWGLPVIVYVRTDQTLGPIPPEWVAVYEVAGVELSPAATTAPAITS